MASDEWSRHSHGGPTIRSQRSSNGCEYQHLSSSFLTEAVGKLDSVFGTVRYQDVTAQNLLTEGESVSY